MPNVKPKLVATCQNPECGKTYSPSHEWQKYCSRKCIVGKGRKHLVCPCGESTGSYQKKYCCSAHNEKWRKHKQPTRMVSHICLGCGNTFERPYNYPSKNKYCSNACAHREVKAVRDKYIADLPEGAVVFKSGWEIRFWSVCLRFDIPVRRYDGPDIHTSVGVYRPDFIINDNRVVEVKGWFRPESQTKVYDAEDQDIDVLLIDEAKLIIIEEGDLSLLEE